MNINIKEITDGNQRAALKNIRHAANWIIGENENSLSDYEEDSEEYIAAKAILSNRAELVEYILSETISNTFGPGYCGPATAEIKAIKFCGKIWLTAITDDVVKSMGY